MGMTRRRLSLRALSVLVLSLCACWGAPSGGYYGAWTSDAAADVAATKDDVASTPSDRAQPPSDSVVIADVPMADLCGARDLGSPLGNAVARGNTTASTRRFDTPTCGVETGASRGGANAPEAVFRWVAPTTGRFQFDTNGSEYDTLLYVRLGECNGAELGCNDDAMTGTTASSVSFTLQRGEVVFIVVDGYGSASGAFVLNIHGDGVAVDAGPVVDTAPVDVPVTPPAADPCADVTAAGRCLGTAAFEYCSVPTGEGTPSLRRYTCGAGEACQVDGDGFANCVVVGPCRENATRCAGSTALERCRSGRWESVSCGVGRCVQTPLGDDCNMIAATRTVSSRVRYETRGPRSDRRDWDAPFVADAQQFLVISLRDAQAVDVQRTDTTGRFSVLVPASTLPSDRIAIVAAGVDATSRQLTYLVADPHLGAGERRTDDTSSPTLSPTAWSWVWNVSSLPSELRITVSAGSGAARVYDYLRYAYGQMSDYFGRPGMPLIVWVGMGTSWSCGSCFNRVPLRALNLDFDAQVWLDGDASDQGYWSDSVTAHELGHWVMASYGVSPGEGGGHTVGVPTFPGQAWSEGWATFVSADVRNDPVYVDKQGGSMFWFDLGARSYSSGAAWNSPAPTRLTDRIDENEVSAMLWRISDTNVPAVYQALASTRLRRAPFGRCYTRHAWSLDAARSPVNVCATRESKPHFADMLDALSCDSFSRTALRGAIGAYPYPVDSPYCVAGVRPSTCTPSPYPLCP